MFQKISSLLPSGLYNKAAACVFLSFLICFAAQFGYSQATTEVTALELGQPIEREIKGGEKHEYKIAFNASQYGKATLEQRGVDVIVRLLDANGKIVIQVDAEPRANGTETIELFSTTAADLHLTIEPRQKSARAGRYEIRFVEQRAATEKEIALDEARKLNTKANQLWIAGKYTDALPIAERALAIRERELGAEHADVGTSVFVLGNVVGDMGDLAKCELLYTRALAIREKALGKNHPLLASIYLNWGVFYKLKGDYVKAEELYGRALAIWDNSLEPNHLLIAMVLNNLAAISDHRGDREKAATLYRRALEIREAALGPEHPDVATSLNNIADLSDSVAGAEALYMRSLAIREKVFGPEHQEVAQTLYNMARLYSSAGDYQKAESLCLRSLNIFEKTLGAEHPFVSYPMNLLAVIYANTGDYERAETLYLRAAALKEKTQGALHPDLGGTYVNLANLYALKGDFEKSAAAQKRANEILEYNTTLNLTIGSEREKLYYLDSLEQIEYQTLTLNFKDAPDSAAAINLGATSVLQRKGRALDAMADSFGALRRRFDKQDQSLLDNLNEATAQLAGFIAEGRQGNSEEEYRRKIKTLEEARETIENQISRRSAGFYESSKPVTLDAVRAAIPDRAALIEFSVYRPISRKAFEFTVGKEINSSAENSRYAVFVITAQGAVRGKDLGSAQEIEAGIEALRRALRDPKSKDARKLARAIDEKIMQPVRALLPDDVTQLLVSPDGDLNLIPFEALVDEQSRYLIERYSFTYLSSGRDLLRMQTPRASKNKFLLVANPSFGNTDVQTNTNLDANAKTNARRAKRRSITATRNLSETYFAPLAGTLQEARGIQTLFPEAEFLTGAQATESALKQFVAPRILHIATHGFFLENAEDESDVKSKLAKRGAEVNAAIENPLLRSGLALAGANQQGENKGDGILTALEASGLNLWGTKLVVLSACDTGLGEVKNGEGVYGLRRAFVLAGTESLVMSLWSVSDYVTRELMTNYYKNLKQGMGRGAALRQVQLEMLKRKGRTHPSYWAGFIQSGEWANLDGKR